MIAAVSHGTKNKKTKRCAAYDKASIVETFEIFLHMKQMLFDALFDARISYMTALLGSIVKFEFDSKNSSRGTRCMKYGTTHKL